ncbi:MAG: hypothetical protein IPL38_19140 [Rhodobacter sp.]|nr:hypothetical protein [Rhodobacter sp.]
MVGRPVYLVMEPQALVAEDLAGAIAEVDPQAIVLRAGSADEAVRALAPHGAIAVAILHCGPDGIAATPLGQALAARGAALVFTGDAAKLRLPRACASCCGRFPTSRRRPAGRHARRKGGPVTARPQ